MLFVNLVLNERRQNGFHEEKFRFNCSGKLSRKSSREINARTDAHDKEFKSFGGNKTLWRQWRYRNWHISVCLHLRSFNSLKMSLKTSRSFLLFMLVEVFWWFIKAIWVSLRSSRVNWTFQTHLSTFSFKDLKQFTVLNLDASAFRHQWPVRRRDWRWWWKADLVDGVNGSLVEWKLEVDFSAGDYGSFKDFLWSCIWN